MFESVITSKGQTTLPKGVRDAVSLRPGDRVRYAVLDNEVWMKKVESAGPPPSLRYYGPPLSLEDMERGVTEAMTREFKGPPEPQTYEDAMERLLDAEEEANDQRRQVHALEAENGELRRRLGLDPVGRPPRAVHSRKREAGRPGAAARA